MKAKSTSDPTAGKFADGAGTKASGPSAAASGTAPPGREGPGYGTVAVSGLVGGIIGAGLFFALAHFGASDAKEDTAKIAALEQQIASLAPRDAVSALDKRLGANEQAARTASDRANEALQKAGTAPATASGTAPAPDLVARLDALDQRVSALQEEPGRDQPADPKAAVLSGGDTGTRLADLDERLKAIESKGSSPDGSAPLPDVAKTLAALQSDVESRAKANESAAQALGQRFDQLQQAVEARVKSATEAVQSATEASKQVAEAGQTQAAEAAKAAGRRLQEQADRIAALDMAVDGTAKAATVRTALQIVAADRIVSALATGAPYADALSSLRNADAGAASRYEALAPYADAGAPTAAALAQSFHPIAEKIAAAGRAAKAKSVAETGGITERLQSMASSIVQVKRSGTDAPSGAASATEEDPTAKVQNALDHGRIAEAAKAFAALPEDVRSQTDDFGAKLKARADAEAAAQALQADGFKSLAAGPAPAAR